MSHTRGKSADSGAPTGVRVYNMAIFKDLVLDTPDHAKRRLAKTPEQPKSAEQARREIREEQFAQYQERQKVQLAEQLRLSQLKAQLKKDMKYEGMVTEIDGGKEMTDSIDTFITVTEASEVTKKEQLYNDWETGVFQRLQTSVNDTIESLDRRSLNKKRNEEFEKFLTASNNPSGVFLDTVFEGDKEPAKAETLHVRTGKVKDPVRKSLLKHQRETALSSKGKSPSHAAKQRETLNATQWSDGKIQATPYGHFAHFVGKVHAPTEMEKKITKSDVKFDSYDFPKDGHSKDSFVGGKRVYTDPKKGNYHSELFSRNGPWKPEQQPASSSLAQAPGPHGP